MLPLYLSPATKFPPSSSSGAHHQLRSENFGVKRTVVKAADPKILGQLLKNFPNTDPVDRTHRTSKRKGGLAGKHPREGRGV